MSFKHLWSFCSSRRFLARLLSTLLCSILIVIRPFSKYGGEAAFLVLTLKELVFSVQDNLAQQFEATVLHLAGGLAGIGLSTLARYAASNAGGATVGARIILAFFLTSISFFAGWLKSRLPRLTLSTRIACFVSIWLLTKDISKPVQAQAKEFLWITITPAVTTLLSSFLLLRWSSPQFACDVASAFSELHSCLIHNLSNTFFEFEPETSAWNGCHMQADLLKRSISLNAVYSQSAFELRLGRVSMKAIKPLIGTVEYLRRELAWGLSIQRPKYEGTTVEGGVIHAFHNPAFELGHAILASMRVIEKLILACFIHAVFPRSLDSEKCALVAAKTRLTLALIAVRKELKKLCEDWDVQQPALEGAVNFPRNIFDLCLFMISLLQMAQDVLHALHICDDVVSTYETSQLRLFYPRLSLAWLGVAPSTAIMDERGTYLDDESQVIATSLTEEETLQGIAERGYTSLRCDDGPKLAKPFAEVNPFSVAWLTSLVYYTWNYPTILRSRLSLSAILRAIQHSPHLQHAFKNAAGVAILSIPAFLPIDSAGQEWFRKYYGQWMLISYVWVLETNTGATWRVAYLRLSGTVLGGAYACVASYICRRNPYAMVVMTAIAEFPASWVVINTTFPSLGIVASVTVPPILFMPYLQSAPPSPIILAAVRSAMISAGIIAALMMNSFLFPRHCRVMFLNSTCGTIGYLSQLYISLSRDLFQPYQNSGTADKRKALKLELSVRKALHRMSVLLLTMNDEISLVPKPMQRYRQLVVILQKLLDTLTGLRKVRENIPRKETVTAVASQRRELISTVCLTLFACEQVFKGRQPLPQFLPSLHGALQTLKRDMEGKIHEARVEQNGSLGLSLIYALAEIDAMTDMVDTLEQLLTLGRQLFGTSSWLHQSSLELSITMSLHEEVGQGLKAV